jgi:hypothetical protein
MRNMRANTTRHLKERPPAQAKPKAVAKKNSSPAKVKKKAVSLAPVVPIEGELIALPKRRGRPERKYTEDLANEILARTADGEGLLSICKSSHMPHERTVRRWVTDDMPPGFADRFARAVYFRHDRWAEEIITIADEPAADMAAVQRNRNRVDSRKWLLSKLQPQRYGDRVDLNVTNKTEKISDDQLEAQLTALMQAKKQDASALETILDEDKPKMITQRPERLAIAKPKPKPVEQYDYGYSDDEDEDDFPKRSVRLVRQG